MIKYRSTWPSLIYLMLHSSCINVSFAQDIIIKRDQTKIRASEVHFEPSVIRFKYFGENPSNDFHSLPLQDIFIIMFEDGTLRTFGEIDSREIEVLLRQNILTYNKYPDLDNFRNQVLELSYTLIPASVTHGADLHIDFFQFPRRKSVWRIPIGFGGGYAQHTYKNYQFSEYTASVLLRRIYAHGTVGFRLQHQHGGITLRAGYNYMYGMYEYGLITPNNLISFDPEMNQMFHRAHLEAVVFKSFSKETPNVGIHAGVQYLIAPKKEGMDLLLIKAGIAF